MADFFSGTLGVVTQWMTSGIFWIAFLIVTCLAILGGLLLRKRRKLNKPVLQLYDVGQIHFKKDGEVDWDKSAGIFEFDVTKGGWFKNHFTMFGLWDYGNEDLFRLKDGTPVYDVSHNDYRQVNGRLGLVVIRSPNDPRFVIPISKFFLSEGSKSAMAEIAPVDLRNAAVQANEQVDTEMKAKWEKIMPYIFAGLMIIGLIIAIMFITQYGKHMVDKASETLRYVAANVGNPNIQVGTSP